MQDPIREAIAAAASCLSVSAQAIGSDAPVNPAAIRFRADGKGGELASPFPLTASLHAAEILRHMPAHPLFSAAYPSGNWIAFDLSEAWRESVRGYLPYAVSLPPAPDLPVFPARIDPQVFRLNCALGSSDPELAARLDNCNPARRFFNAAGRAGNYTGVRRTDRRLVNEAAFFFYRPSPQQALKIADLYLASPSEDRLVLKIMQLFTEISP